MLKKMLSNPLKNNQETSRFVYPFHVCYVYLSGEEYDPNYRLAKELCDEKGIKIVGRLFDPIKYDEDADFIAKLPAFHIYEKKNWQDTFYDNPAMRINIKILEFKREREEQTERKKLKRQKSMRLVKAIQRLLRL